MSVQKAIEMLKGLQHFEVISTLDLNSVLAELERPKDEGTITFTNTAYSRFMREFDEMAGRINRLESALTSIQMKLSEKYK